MKNKLRSVVKTVFSRKFIRKLLIQSLVFLFFLELSLLFLTKLGWLNVTVPSYSLQSNKAFKGHYDPEIGYLHIPGEKSRFYRSCYDFEMHYNREGFRDVEHKKHTDGSRILFLGDSFTEGFGVNEADRFSNRIQQKLGLECLNFGISGLGPVHYQEVYRKYGLRYEHDVVVISIYPVNDFTDDLPLAESNRFKPCWKMENGKWTFHKPSIVPKRNPYQHSGLKAWLYAYSYTYHLLLYCKGLFSKVPDNLSDHSIYDEHNWSRMQRALKEIRTLAGNRKVVLFSIPSLSEIRDPVAGETNHLSEEMTLFCEENDIHFLDLASAIFNLPPDEQEVLYLDCDGHFSQKGNEFVANRLVSVIKEL